MNKLIALFTLLFSISSFAFANNKQVTIGTGSVTGVYYPTGGAICRIVNKDIKYNHMRCMVEATNGSKSNIEGLVTKKFNFALAQADVVSDAMAGQGDFKEPAATLKTILPLYDEVLTVAVRADSGIKSIADLKGKKVNIGAIGSGSSSLFHKVISEVGLTDKDFAEISDASPENHESILCDKKTDAIIYVSGNPNASIAEVTKFCDAYILPMDNDLLNKLTARYSFYKKSMIRGGLYPNNPTNIPTISVKALLITTDEQNADNVYEMTKAIISNFDIFRTLHPVLGQLSLELITKIDNVTAPLHVGSAKYFDEIKKSSIN